MALACLERETACLKSRVGICFRLSFCWHLPTLQVGIFHHHIGVKSSCHFVRFARLPIISFAHRRLSCVRGTKVKCRWGVFSSMCTTADTMFSRPTLANKEVSRPLEKCLYLFGLAALKTPGWR